jgi:predicted NAD/FAD-binding protein
VTRGFGIALASTRTNFPSSSDWMNDLQRLSADKHGHLFATLNPLSPPSASRVLGRYSYSHPVLSSDAVRAQRALAQLNASAAESGRNRAFAGAWARYGFHEDGFTTGLRVAASLPDVALPFSIADADVERGEPSVSEMARVFDVLEGVRAFIAFIVGKVLVVLAAALGSTKKVD